jgi:hypothetical protein
MGTNCTTLLVISHFIHTRQNSYKNCQTEALQKVKPSISYSGQLTIQTLLIGFHLYAATFQQHLYMEYISLS